MYVFIIVRQHVCVYHWALRLGVCVFIIGRQHVCVNHWASGLGEYMFINGRQHIYVYRLAYGCMYYFLRQNVCVYHWVLARMCFPLRISMYVSFVANRYVLILGRQNVCLILCC